MALDRNTVVLAGQSPDKARKTLIMLHGRGDSARSFITLAGSLDVPRSEFAFLAVQAIGNTWYPYSFLVPLQQNEPQLSRSLSVVSEVVHDLEDLQFTTGDIYFLGFSQGACLTLEFCARNAKPYGGIIAFTGGLLGDRVNTNNYQGNFEGAPVFIGSSDHDPHVPESRISESEMILNGMGAKVTTKIYPGMGHTINEDELNIASRILEGF
jgi:phospholipase/carboxylesterase